MWKGMMTFSYRFIITSTSSASDHYKDTGIFANIKNARFSQFHTKSCSKNYNTDKCTNTKCGSTTIESVVVFVFLDNLSLDFQLFYKEQRRIELVERDKRSKTKWEKEKMKEWEGQERWTMTEGRWWWSVRGEADGVCDDFSLLWWLRQSVWLVFMGWETSHC